MTKTFSYKLNHKFCSLALLSVLLAHSTWALDFSEGRLRELGVAFNKSAKNLEEISKAKVCDQTGFLKASAESANISLVKGQVTGILTDLGLEIKRVETDIQEIKLKLDPSAGKAPNNFLQVIMALMSNPDIIEKGDQEKLISIVNEALKVSFVDSSGKRRYANNANREGLNQDREAKAVLLNVGLSLLVDSSQLKSFSYTAGSIVKSDNRISSSETKPESNMFYLSDATMSSMSASSKMLTLHAQPSIEAVPLGYDNKDNGVGALSSKLTAMTKLVDLPKLREVLAKVKTENQKALSAASVSAEEAAVLAIKSDKLSQELADMKESQEKWAKLSQNIDMPSVRAGMQFKSCEVAYNKFKRDEAQKAAKPKAKDSHATTDKKEDEGVLKGVLD